MQLKGRKRTTAAAIAVIGALVGGAVVAGPLGSLVASSAPDAAGGPGPGVGTGNGAAAGPGGAPSGAA
ncbi:hypothetical protein ABZ607_03465, partial [Streptomyces sp. NPDC007369]